MKITWPGGREVRYDAWFLRESCRCAGCRDEHTGEILIKPGSVSKDMKIVKSEIIGNYALGFGFSDGHSTGIYSFDYLAGLEP